MPYVRKTKRTFDRKNLWKVAVGAILGAALVAALGGLWAKQQATIERNAEAASQFTPRPVTKPASEVAAPTAAFIGDSYAQGTGATATTSRWSTLVSESQGWEELNVANGGTGYATAIEGETAMDACGKDYCPTYAEVIPEVAEQEPSIVVVSGGRNDVNQGIDPASIQSFYRELRASLPDAQIIAVSPVWDAREAPAELTAITEAVQEAVTAVDGSYVDVGQPFTGKPSLITEDDVHPNDAGHKALAEAVTATLD